MRIDELFRAERGAAFLALVTVCAFIAALGAGSHDVAVGQEHFGFRIVELLALLLDEFAFIVELAEKFGGVTMVRRRSGSRIDVEGNAEIGERFLDDVVVLVYDILGGASLLAGRDRDGHAVFVGAAHEEGLASTHPQVTDIDVGRDIHAGQMADVDRTVGIRQRASDEIPFFHNLFNSFDNLFFTVLSTCRRATSSRRLSWSPPRWARVISRAVAVHCWSVMRSL